MKVQKEFINYLLVYLLLFLSGSWRYMQASNKYLILGFFAAFIAWLLFSDRRFSDRFLLYIIFFIGLYLSLSLYTGGGITLPSIAAAFMKMMIAYLILKTIGSKFSETYIKLVVFLAVISLFGYLSDRFNLFEALVTKLPRGGDISTGNTGYEGIFYLFRFPWHITRNNSIFYEPGAYQAFLNAALFLIFFTKTTFERREKWIYIAILVITLITTYSTTGFLIFLAMFPLFLYKSDIFSFSNKALIIGAASIVVVAFSAQFYSTFVVKIDQYLSAGEHELGTSALERGSDVIADMQIFKKHIFGLGYDQYQEEFDRVGRRKVEGGSTNGVTKTLAMMGLPFSLFIFGSYLWAFKRLLGDLLLTTLAFSMFLLFLAGESYYMATPITYAIIAAAFVFYRGSAEDRSELTASQAPPSVDR